MEKPPASPSLASLKLPLSPVTSRLLDTSFYDHEEDDDAETLHLPDTLDELIGPIPELGEPKDCHYADTGSVSALDEAIEAMLAKRRVLLLAQTRAAAAAEKSQDLDREIEEYFRQRREEQQRERQAALGSEQEQQEEDLKTQQQQQQQNGHSRKADRRKGFVAGKVPRATGGLSLPGGNGWS